MAFSRSKIRIAVSTVDTNPSALVATNVDWIEGQIKTYSKSGGDRDVESDPVFGGFVDKEKPVEQIELGFEVIPDESDADKWDALAYAVDSGNAGVYTSAGDIVKKAVFITTQDSATNPKSWCFNNCNVTLYDFEHSADDNQTSNMTMKFSPTDTSGVANFMTRGTDILSMPAWTALDNN